ncbi:hypothetical protein ABZ601_33650 [Streptomyces sp. NPDC012842]|uniref:hypothetical protein n=1 Tax=Streptomyces TaxID=1883 RepID=UPI0033E08D3A
MNTGTSRISSTTSETAHSTKPPRRSGPGHLLYVVAGLRNLAISVHRQDGHTNGPAAPGGTTSGSSPPSG